MPIKGLSERRRYSRGGKLRLGEKRTSANGKEYPAKIEYFLFDPEDESLIEKFHAIYGEKPKRLRVVLPSNNRDEIFPQDYKCYGRSGLLCKGNGETALRIPEGGGEMMDVECPGPSECPYAMSRGQHGKSGCKPVASLQVILPDLPVLQTWQIDTSSINSIVNINSALDMLEKIAGRIGFIGIDLVLIERETMIQETGKKGTIFVMDLIIPVGLRQATMLESFGAAAGAPYTQLLAPPADESTPDALFPASQILGDAPAETPPPSAAQPGKKPWSQWLDLKVEYGLSDDVIKAAMDHLLVPSFAKAGVEKQQQVVDYIRESLEPSVQPAPTPAPTPAPIAPAAPINVTARPSTPAPAPAADETDILF